MYRRPNHINLVKLSNKMWASCSQKDWCTLYRRVPKDPADVHEVLKAERLALTDYSFRQRYARWL